MKKIYLIIALLAGAFTSEAQTYKYQVITSVESINHQEKIMNG